MSSYIHKRWNTFKANIEYADIAFVLLRAIIFLGVAGWLIFSHVPQKTAGYVTNLIVFFFIYSIFIYILLFFLPKGKRIICKFSLLFDFLFTTLLVKATGGFESSFSNGFYLMTALYSFYFGPVAGAVIATLAMSLYFISGNFDFSSLYWTDFSVRVAFLFLLSLSLGMLSQKLKKDKHEITNLNNYLQKYIEELKNVHGRLIQIEKMSELGRMAADVAHEIRNPLTSIGGFAKRLEKKLSQVTTEKECISMVLKEKEYTEVIISEVNRLEQILRDVLTFSREAIYNLEYQEINSIIKETLTTFDDICKEQSIRTEEKYNASLPEVLIDRSQVRQAAINIISNAIGAMSEGGIIKVKTYMEELHAVNYVVAEVTDTGHGIPEDKLNMIFEPFYSSKEIGSGTGLGLTICKKIIDEHNGIIRVESELGSGTSFKLYFPYVSKEERNKIKCWEFHKCGVEKTEGAALIKCSAYPNYGRICWAVAGTFCGKRVSGAIAQKIGDCKKCAFYKRVVINKDL
jgi:signal transduction histidine kinase